MRSSRRQVVPKTKSDIIIRWKEIEKEFSLTGFFSVDPFVGHVRRLRRDRGRQGLKRFPVAFRKVKTEQARDRRCTRSLMQSAAERSNTFSCYLAIFRDSNHDVWHNRRSTVSRVNYRCCSGMISLQLPKHTHWYTPRVSIISLSFLAQRPASGYCSCCSYLRPSFMHYRVS